jgi:hypothetical protein
VRGVAYLLCCFDRASGSSSSKLVTVSNEAGAVNVRIPLEYDSTFIFLENFAALTDVACPGTSEISRPSLRRQRQQRTDQDEP